MMYGLGMTCAGFDADGNCNSYVGSDAGGTPTMDQMLADANARYAAEYGSSGPSGNASTGFNWGFLNPLASAAANVFGTRYAVPQLNPGQTIQTGPGGTLLTQQPAGYPATGGVLGGSASSITPLLLIGAVGLVVVVMVMKK